MKLLSAAGVLAALSFGRDVTTHEGRKARDVQLSINEDLCLFENADDKWCFSVTPPMVKAGWEVKQTFTTTPTTETPVIEYYQWQLQPYLQI